MVIKYYYALGVHWLRVTVIEDLRLLVPAKSSNCRGDSAFTPSFSSSVLGLVNALPEILKSQFS